MRRTSARAAWTWVVGAAAAAFAAALQPAAAQDKIVLKGITPWVTSYYWSEPFLMFQNMVNAHFKGRVTVTYLGGPEVVPTFEQFEALRNGTVDVALNGASYYTGQIPEAMAVQYAKVPPTELRKNGFYKLMRDLHAERGVVYLANVGGSPGTAFRLFSNAKLQQPGDLNGLKFRVTPVYVALVKAYGGTPINMAPSEVYAALERKVVDGYGWSYGGITDFGWQEVTKYVVDHPFYTANTAILFNKKAWDGLPADVRAGLEEIGVQLEARAEKFMADYLKREDVLLKGLGVEKIRFADADAKKFLDTAYEAGWKEYFEKNPQFGPKIRPLTE